MKFLSHHSNAIGFAAAMLVGLPLLFAQWSDAETTSSASIAIDPIITASPVKVTAPQVKTDKKPSQEAEGFQGAGNSFDVMLDEINTVLEDLEQEPPLPMPEAPQQDIPYATTDNMPQQSEGHFAQNASPIAQPEHKTLTPQTAQPNLSTSLPIQTARKSRLEAEKREAKELLLLFAKKRGFTPHDNFNNSRLLTGAQTPDNKPIKNTTFDTLELSPAPEANYSDNGITDILLQTNPPKLVDAIATQINASAKVILPTLRPSSKTGIIRSGNILSLSLAGEESLTGDFPVKRDGTINLPEIGAISVAGLTTTVAKDKIIHKLKTVFKNVDRFQLELKERNLYITVLGFVGTPGEVELPEDANVQMAISAAGGLAVGAQLDRIQVRRNEQVFTFNYKKYLNSGDMSLLPELEPLDVIFVPASPLMGAVQTPFSAETFAGQSDGANDADSIKIFGEVRTPTTMAYREDTTLIDAIMRSGGLGLNASSDKIRVATKDGTNLYNLQAILDSNDLAQIPVIPKGATIFVPRIEERSPSWLTIPSSRAVQLIGAVKTPGRYEWSDEMSFFDLIAEAGGPNKDADLSKIKILQKDGGEASAVVFNMAEFIENGGDYTSIPQIRAGYTIIVPSTEGNTAKTTSSVRVLGEVQRPGNVDFKQDISLIDILLETGGVTNKAAVDKIRVINGGKPVYVNLQSYLDTGDASLLPVLQAGATIFVPRAKEGETTRTGETIYVMGEVVKPGSYEVNGKSEFIEALSLAGGPTGFANTNAIRIIHANGTVTDVDLSAFTEGLGIILPTIVSGDTIFVPRSKNDPDTLSWLDTPPEKAVEIIGAVQRPNRYEWSDNMSFFDLIAQAGGPLEKADMSRVQLLLRENGQTRTYEFDMDRFIKEGGPEDQIPKITAGYVINVPFQPETSNSDKAQWLQQDAANSIYVMGQVGSPGRYGFNKRMNFLDILSAADGPTKTADLRNIRVSHRNRGQAGVSQINLSLYFETGDETLLPNVLPGDVIYIPDVNREWLDKSKESTVRVMGAVGKAGRYRFADDMTILDLLAEAGGPTSAALQNKIVVVNMSCCKDQAKLFDLVKFSKTGDSSLLPVIRTGDTVFVPDKEQGGWAKLIKGVKETSALLTFALAIMAL